MSEQGQEHPRSALIQRYCEHATLRALIQLVPFGVGSAVDVYLATRWEAIQEERTRRFFDRLRANGLSLSEDEVESEDFLHCFFATVEVVQRTRRREKIDLFADLLTGGVRSSTIGSADEYEEYVGQLEELSNREIAALAIMEEYERRHPQGEGEHEYDWVRRYWDDLVSALASRLQLSDEEVDPFLRRLGRSGFLQRVSASPPRVNEGSKWETWSFDVDSEKGRLSGRYQRLMGILADAQGR
jgi:hypothetical protein